MYFSLKKYYVILIYINKINNILKTENLFVDYLIFSHSTAKGYKYFNSGFLCNESS